MGVTDHLAVLCYLAVSVLFCFVWYVYGCYVYVYVYVYNNMYRVINIYINIL